MERFRRTRLVGLGVVALLLGLAASPTAQAVPAGAAVVAPRAAAECTGSWDGITYWAKSPSGQNGGGYARTYWNTSTRHNCVKFWSSPYDGLASHITLNLYDEIGNYVSDPPQGQSANYHYFAGPLYTWYDATGKCIRATGSLIRGGVTYRLNTGWVRCG